MSPRPDLAAATRGQNRDRWIGIHRAPTGEWIHHPLMARGVLTAAVAAAAAAPTLYVMHVSTPPPAASIVVPVNPVAAAP